MLSFALSKNVTNKISLYYLKTCYLIAKNYMVI